MSDAPRVITSAAEAEELVGQPLGTSEGILVDQQRIDAFAEVTGDHQWIHVDPDRAATGPFGTTVAHGYLTLSLLPALLPTIFRLDFGTARINYGLNKVRFPQPVPAGSVLRATAELLEVRRHADATTIVSQVVVTADGATKPACVAESVVLVVGGDADE